MSAPLLEVEGLTVSFRGRRERRVVVRDVGFSVGAGEVLAVVGESGSGKTVSCLAALDLLGPGARIDAGRMRLEGETLFEVGGADRRRAARGGRVAMIFQDPMNSLNPFLRVGTQVTEALHRRGVGRGEARRRAVDSLRRCGLSEPEALLGRHPHELSGGMRQRVMIAMMLALEPAVLLADEPTTALDVTTQARILALLGRLRDETGTAVVLVSHDLGAVAGLADRLVVMRTGEVVESGRTERVFAAPSSDYARELIAASPRLDGPGPAPPRRGPNLLVVEGLRVAFGRGRRRFVAVEDVDLVLGRGETLALVGESGSGKSTILRAISGLAPVEAGEIRIDGRRSEELGARARGRLLPMVFQDPYGALDPRQRVREIVAEPLEVHAPDLGRAAREARVEALLEEVGLARETGGRHPHQLSGGQRQRVGIARALASDPAGVLLDEATSALDVSVQARVLELLARLRRDRGLGYLFVSHDLGVVRRVADRIAVLHAGRVVETGAAEDLLARPLHPYTRILLEAVPIADPRVERARMAARPAAEAEVAARPARGCRFAPRCPLVEPRCREIAPIHREVGAGRTAACHLVATEDRES